MIRFRYFATLLGMAALAVCACAQGTTGGLLYASDFANWSLPQGNTPMQGTVFYPNPGICRVTSSGYTFLAPKVGRPMTIVDGANTETFTPTSVVVNNNVCMISGTMAHSHSTYSIQSGTAGAQEAIDYQATQQQGAQIVITPAWTKAGGTTGIITGTLTGNNGVTLLDQRTSQLASYTWNGSNYVASQFASVANGSTVGHCAQIGANGHFAPVDAPTRPPHPSNFPDIEWTARYPGQQSCFLEYQGVDGTITQRYVILLAEGRGSNGHDYIEAYDGEWAKTFRRDRIRRFEVV